MTNIYYIVFGVFFLIAILFSLSSDNDSRVDCRSGLYANVEIKGNYKHYQLQRCRICGIWHAIPKEETMEYLCSQPMDNFYNLSRCVQFITGGNFTEDDGYTRPLEGKILTMGNDKRFYE